MKRYNHLFEQVCSMENLKLALHKAKKGKMSLARTREVVSGERYYLPLLQQMLLNQTFRTSQYKKKVIREPRNALFIYCLSSPTVLYTTLL